MDFKMLCWQYCIVNNSYHNYYFYCLLWWQFTGTKGHWSDKYVTEIFLYHI